MSEQIKGRKGVGGGGGIILKRAEDCRAPLEHLKYGGFLKTI